MLCLAETSAIRWYDRRPARTLKLGYPADATAGKVSAGTEY